MCIHPWFNTKVNMFMPCGQCSYCRANKITLWSNRIQSEINKSRSTFLTLTYDSNHLTYVKDEQGKINYSLNKNDVHKFFDNLRHQVKNLPLIPLHNTKDFKYLLVGEYGGRFNRPHYHAIVMGLDFKQFKQLYINLWRHGSIKSLPTNNATVRYCLDYMSKNLNGELAQAVYDKLNIERPFMNCSNKIGFDYFQKHSEEINNTGFIKNANKLLQVPTYYKNLFYRYDIDSVTNRKQFQFELQLQQEEFIKKNYGMTLKQFNIRQRNLYAKVDVKKRIQQSLSLTDEQKKLFSDNRKFDNSEINFYKLIGEI